MKRFAVAVLAFLALVAAFPTGAQQPSDLPLLLSTSAPKQPRVGDLVFGAQGNTGFPTYANATGFTVTSGYESFETETQLPAQPINWRLFAMEAWGVTTGIAPIENAAANGSAIYYGSLFTNFTGSSFIGDIPYTQFGTTITNGGFTLSDPLPAVSDGAVARHVLTTPLGGTRGAGYNIAANGEAQRRSATASTFDAIRTSGTGASAGSGTFVNEAWQIAGIVAPMTAGQRVVLEMGTSIMRIQDATYRFLLSPGNAGSMQQGTFTGAIAASTGVLTVSGFSATNGGALGVRTYLTGTGVPDGTFITSKISGTGGNGTYSTNITTSVASTAMTGRIGRNAYGYMAVGLDNPTNTRMGWWQAAVNGANIAQQDHYLSGSFLQRYNILLKLAQLNGGHWPFTDVALDFRNDAVLYNGTDAADTANQMIASTKAGIEAVRKLFPGMPIHIVDLPPIQPATFSPWYATDTANQTPTGGNFKSAAVIIYNAYIATNKAALGIASVIPAGSAAIAPDDGSGLAKWKISPFNLAGGGTLIADTAIGTNMITVGIGINAAVPPEIGSYIVFEPGGANAEAACLSGSVITNGQISQVINIAAGQYTVKVVATGTGISCNTTKTHLAGTVVKTTLTQDLTHPSDYLQNGPMADAVTTWKATIPAIIPVNFLLKRDVNPAAANDDDGNDPMWLDKAA
jgi:hypothetical protein